MPATGPPPTPPRRPPGEEGAPRPAPPQAAERALRAEGKDRHRHDRHRHDRHRHDRHKVRFCVAGSIVFSTDEGEVALGPGDRLDVPPGVAHAAAVGPAGVACEEADRP